MLWYARPDGEKHQLRFTPTLFSGEKTSDPEQIRLREFTSDTAALLAGSRIDGPWALRLDVGLPTGDLLKSRDLDNYAYPLARRLQQDRPDLVSVWCTKQRGAQSFVRIEAARVVHTPPTDVRLVKTTTS